MIAIVAAAACGAPASALLAPPSDGTPADHDGGTDASEPADPADGSTPGDAGIDAPDDADPIPPDAPAGDPDLAALCGGTAPVTLDDWEACYRLRECQREVGCITLNTYLDVADCVASWDAVDGGQRAADRQARQRAVELGHASLDVAAFTQCLGLISTTRCIDPTWDAACATRFTGTIGGTATCFEDTDCASPGAVCQSACHDSCCAGTCQAKPGVGQACTDDVGCQPGLQCNDTICITGDLNTACSDVLQCDFDYWCDTRAHRCKAKLAQGSSCTDILQCRGGDTCLGLSITDSTPGKCRANSHVGDPCADTCFGNLYCDRNATCHALPVLGDGCSPLIPCAGTNTICNGGVCSVRGDVGVPCGNQTCLPELFCTSELGPTAKPTCAARRGAGAACTDLSQCASHVCSGTPDLPGVCLAWRETCP